MNSDCNYCIHKSNSSNVALAEEKKDAEISVLCLSVLILQTVHLISYFIMENFIIPPKQ